MNKKQKMKRENPHSIILIMRVSDQRPMSHPCINTEVFIFHPTASYPFAVILTMSLCRADNNACIELR